MTFRQSYRRDWIVALVAWVPTAAVAASAEYAPSPMPAPALVIPILSAVLVVAELALLRRLNAITLEGGVLTGPSGGSWLRARIRLEQVDTVATCRRSIFDRCLFQTRVRARSGDTIVINHAAYDRDVRRQILLAAGLLPASLDLVT